VKGFAGGFVTVSGVVYVMLATNLGLVVTGAPFWGLALLVDLRLSWLWAGLCALLLAPGLAGAYAVFTAYSRDGEVSALRGFFAGWRASWRRVAPVGLALQGFVLVVGVDLYALNLWGYGLVGLPIAVVLIGLAILTGLISWVGLAERPDLTRRAVVKASVYLGVRKVGWSLLSLVILGLVASITWTRPAIGLGLLAAPGLYVVWGNSRRTLASILPPGGQLPAPPRPPSPPPGNTVQQPGITTPWGRLCPRHAGQNRHQPTQLAPRRASDSRLSGGG
jgi:uncharacterized membrane protein YesL